MQTTSYSPKLGLFLAVGLLLASLVYTCLEIPAAQAADNVIHYTIHPIFQGTELVDPNDPRFECNPGATELTVNAMADVDITEFIDGPNAGKIRQVVDFSGSITIKATSGVYTGTFVQHLVQTNESKSFSFKTFVHVNGTAPDGSVLKYNFQAQTRIVDGAIKIDFLKSTCIK